MSSIGIAVVRQSGAALRSGISWLGSASLIALTAMLAFAPHSAYAANECGTATVGGTITCTGTSYPSPGISYNVNGLTVVLNNPNLVAQKTTAGGGAVYLFSGATNVNDVIVNALSLQSLQTTAPLAAAINVANQGTAGNAIIRMDTGTATSASNSTLGTLFANISASAGSGNALITLNGGQVNNTGAGYGATARNVGTGDAAITMTGGSVSSATGGGLRAIIANTVSSGAASVTIGGGTVTTSSGTGVLSQSELGSAGITVTAGTVTVQGGTNPVLSAVVNNTASTATASIAMSGGTVTNNGSGDGLFASNKGTGTYNISLTGGTVTGGSGTGAAIHSDATAGGTITIGSGATVNAGASGIALSQTGGAATITTGGTVTGNLNLSAASNVLDVTGGAVNGNISGGGNSALKFDLGSGSFTYGAAYAISGMNSVAMNSGSAEIDGSLATNTLAVNGGSLILNGAATVSSGTTISAGSLQLGNGGTSGSITGDVVNNGMLAFDRSDAYTFAGLISGSGAVNQIGSGTTVLSGNNSYTGGTTISAGTLIVNGDQSAATGLTTVQSGATLGGNGTIGGSVTVANGGTLSPGNVGNAPGTLTIQKDLVLNGGSVLSYNFGQANVVGGALNDLTKVNGNLTLAGTLNVTTSPGGSFNPGVYRVISYAGTLTNNGLAVGTIPSPGYYVQTSIANQVNLVNTTGVTLNFWDGTAGPKNNGVVDGGNGVWQNSAGNDNWTTADGTINAPYSNGSFAIFAGTAGTVTIDNTLGQVSASGMQFATDGYHLVGGAIALVGAPTVIRVGDGTAAGAGYVATIDNVLTGNSQLVKADLGTLVLNGLNTYTGGTAVTGGTLSISSDANLGASGTSLTLDTGTLQTTASITSDRNVTIPTTGTFLTKAGTTLTLNGTVSGAGDLVKDGGGTLLLNGLATNAGSTTVAGGTLQAGGSNVLSAISSFSVLSGGTLDLNGQGQTIASLSNAGTVKLGGTPGTTLKVTGNYGGNGGLLTLNTALGNDASTTDRLVVQGGTSGTTSVKMTNVGGHGAQTVEGIKIIDVAGASNGTFSLLGDYVFQGQQAVVGGAYAYTLQKNGISTPTDGDWYLRSSLINPPPATPAGPLYQPGVPLYENYAQVLLGMNEAPSLQQRVGNRYWGGSEAMARAGVSAAAQPDGSWTQSAFWGRIEGGQASLQPSNTTGSTYNADQMKAQAGLDGLALENAYGRLIVGLTAQYGLTTAYVNSFFGNGTIRASGSGVGATATWYGDNGIYVDGQAQTMFYRADLSSVLTGSMTHGNEGVGYAFSVEGGKRIGVGNGFWLTPQAQLAYSKVDFDPFTDRFGAQVSLGKAGSLLGRIGLALNHQRTWNDGSGIVRSDVYAISNLHYEFLNGTRVDVAGTSFASASDRLWGSIGGGGTYSWASGRYAIFGEVTYRASLDNPNESHSYKGTGGFRVTW